MENQVILRDAELGQWLLFEQPLQLFESFRHAEVPAILATVERAVAEHGLYAVGMLSYEAAPAFDRSLTVRADGAFPLLWFGLFREPRRISLPEGCAEHAADTAWCASMPPAEYRLAFDRIKRHIREGDAYQVNLTYRLCAAFKEDPYRTFVRLVTAHDATYGAMIATSGWSLCSASPELFFRLGGALLESRPMKGTAARGLTPEADRAQADALRASEKNRAENLMIVDMVRNDLGRVAKAGSVVTPRLFTLEKYPTLWQLTSTVQAQTQASVAEIMAALFPAASITGAPKNSAMRLIAEVESTPRRAYTGTIGFIAPGRRAQFNVAIRTLLVDHAGGQAEYGVGGGIVWDSECEQEQAECRTKALILNASAEPFALLETLLWTPEAGYALLDRHVARLSASAEYFGYAADRAETRARLAELAGRLPQVPHRIRLLIAKDGGITLQFAPIELAAGGPPVHVAFAPRPVDKSDPFLYHKTTRRRVYEEALAERPGYGDVLLYNAQGEVTEATRANVVAEINGTLCTPPVRSGLLAGTYRQMLLDTHVVEERILTIPDMRQSPRVFLVNSVRGMLPARVCP